MTNESRAAFEAWWCKAYHPAALRPMEAGCYLNRSAGLAWDAWMAATAHCAEAEPIPTGEAQESDFGAFEDAQGKQG